MAQDIQKIADILIVQAAIAFRNMSQMPMLVNRSYDAAAVAKNKEIDVPIWMPMTVNDVVPGTPSAATDLTPDVAKVIMDQWKETRWLMSDKEMAEVQDSRTVPEALQRGLIALGDTIDLFILKAMYQGGYTKQAWTSTATVADIVDARKSLNVNKAPRQTRRLVLSDTIEAELLKLQDFYNVEKVGDTTALREASLGRKFQFDIFSNGQLPTHTAGTASGWTVNGNQAAQISQSGGYSTIAVTAGTGAFLAGDRITFASHAQQYSVIKPGTTSIEVVPRLQVAITNTSAISVVNDGATHVIGGLAFQQLAYVFALRPLSSQNHPSVIESQATDPVTGVTLRMEVTRPHKQLVWCLDVLYGGKVIYPEAIVRLSD